MTSQEKSDVWLPILPSPLTEIRKMHHGVSRSLMTASVHRLVLASSNRETGPYYGPRETQPAEVLLRVDGDS